MRLTSADVVIFIETNELTDERKRILEDATGAIVRTVPNWLIEKLDRSVPEGFSEPTSIVRRYSAYSSRISWTSRMKGSSILTAIYKCGGRWNRC